jgi:hypothetical protein
MSGDLVGESENVEVGSESLRSGKSGHLFTFEHVNQDAILGVDVMCWFLGRRNSTYLLSRNYSRSYSCGCGHEFLLN